MESRSGDAVGAEVRGAATRVETTGSDARERKGARADTSSLGVVAVVVATVCLHSVGALATVLVSIGEPAIGAALGIMEIHDNRLTEAFIGAQVCLLPISGRLIATWGIVGVLRRCSVGFILAALATVLVAMSPELRSLGSLSLLLALQGAFAAPLTPATQALVVETFRDARRPRGLALWAASQYLGFVLGATLAGWIVERLSWQLLFAVAPLLAVVPLPFFAWSRQPHSQVRGAHHPLSIHSRTGRALVATSAALAMLAAVASMRNANLGRGVAAVAAVAGLFAFGIDRPRTRDSGGRASLLSQPWLSALADRWFAIAALLMLGIQALTTGQFEVLLLFGPLDAAPETVSLRTLVGGLAQIGAAAVAGYTLGRSRVRTAIALSLVLMSVGSATYLLYTPGVDEWTLLWTRVVVGLGAGLATPALACAAFRNLPASLTAQGATLFAVASSLGVLLGLVVLDTVFSAATAALGVGQLDAYRIIIQVETLGLAALLILTLPLHDRASKAE